MFPYQQGDEFSFQISSNPYQEDIVQEDPIWGNAQDFLQGSDPSNLVETGQQHNNNVASANTNDASSEEKKIKHKEIERQRRQQMSTLHASLRSLLPLESIKGKRSMSDHMNEAVNYIKHLKNNIQELSDTRDRLKGLSNSSKESSDSSCVTVGAHLGGVEIVISTGSAEEGFLLSRVLEAVIEEGFDVLSCLSTKKDERFCNTIQCEAGNFTSIDLAGLEQKLNDVILSSRDNSNDGH